MVTLDPRLATSELNEELIEHIKDKIVERLNPRMIILFGSYVRGCAKPGSDLDLLIIYDGPERNLIVRRWLDELLWGREFPLDVLVRKPEEIEMNIEVGNIFYTREILQKGRILYERT